MIIKDVKGIIFNTFNYKENDLIVDVLSDKYGFIQLYVRGAQKTTSKSFFIFKLFNYICFDISNLNLGGLSSYKSGSIIDVFDYTKLNYEQINAIMYISELLVKIKRVSDYDFVEYFCNVRDVIKTINSDTNISMLYVINYLLLKTLKILGCAPILDCCGSCYKKNDIVVYDLDNNSFICKDCFDGENKYNKDKNFLNYLYLLDKKIEGDSKDEKFDRIVFELLSVILNDNTGVYLLAQKFI